MGFAAALPIILQIAPQLLQMLNNSGGGGDDNGLTQQSNYTPEQQQHFEQTGKNLKGMQGGYDKAIGILQSFLDPNSDIYKNFEAPYMQEFQNRTIPNIAERFAGAGGGLGGALSSSGFGQALSTAGSELQTKLAAMKSGLQTSAIEKLLNNYNQTSQNYLGAEPFDLLNQQKGAGNTESFLGGLDLNKILQLVQSMKSGSGGSYLPGTPSPGIYSGSKSLPNFLQMS